RHAELRDVEVGVAGVVAGSVANSSLARVSCREACAVGSLGSGDAETVDVVVGAAVITDGGVAAEQAGRPVRVPVVVEGTADAPGRGQDDAIGTTCAREIEAVGGRTEANALVGTGAAATEHRKVLR